MIAARYLRRASLLPAAMLVAALFAGPVQGTETPAASDAGAKTGQEATAERYGRCMALTRQDARAALEQGRLWQESGGGNPARHCVAAAFMALGQYDQAAIRLDTLADLMAQAPEGLRAGVLGQAADGWLMAGQTDRALADLDRAVALTPDDLELRVDRSIARGTAGRYEAAIEDLDLVLAAAPGRSDVLVLRASAWRRLDRPERARKDVEKAVALNPNDPEAFLERGILRRLQGDGDGARQDWLRVLELAPDAPVAESARLNLEKLDVNTD